ncbi:hypothetical protein KRR40_15110 [Niabella defluvii]|nr:hypothetical protein KRR40_15110 [Niabella sp. I65]
MQCVLKALAGLCLLLLVLLCPNLTGAQTYDSALTRELEEVQVNGSKKGLGGSCFARTSAIG